VCCMIAVLLLECVSYEEEDTCVLHDSRSLARMSHLPRMGSLTLLLYYCKKTQ